MVRGYTLISILAVTISLGFFKPSSLDDLTKKINLDESPKESTASHIVYISNHLDQYTEAVIHLKEKMNINNLDVQIIESYILPKSRYETEIMLPDDSIWTVDASIIGNKSNLFVNGSRYRSGEFTKNLTEAIFESANNLAQLMKFASDNLVPPEFQNYMDTLQQPIETIYQNVGEWMGKEEKILVYEIQKKMVKSHNELFFLRQTLTLMAKETIDRANRIIRLLKKFKKDDHETNKKRLQYSAKKMKHLLKRSFSILEDAIKIYKKIVDDVKIIKQKIQDIIFKFGHKDEEGYEALEEYKHWRRVEAYGGATGCVIFLPTCAITYPVAWKIVEDKIAKETAKFNQMVNATKEAEKDANLLLDKMDEKSKYVEEELTLIKEWKIHVSMVQESGFEPENIVDFLERKEDKVAINNLCKLTKVCKDYIDHHMPGLEDLEIVSPPLDETCLGDGVIQPTLKCKPYDTKGRSIIFYKIVRGLDPDYDCVVEVDHHPYEDRHERPTKDTLYSK